MASPLIPRGSPSMLCIKHMTGRFKTAFQFPGHRQIRGKKKLAKVSTVKVHLLQNMPGYGRSGAVIPVMSGMMRNIWYPKKMAEYMTVSKMQELGIKKELVVERDGTFGSKSQRKLEKTEAKKTEKTEKKSQDAVPFAHEEAPVVAEELALLSPEQSTSILESLLPRNVDFYRTPITISQPAKRVSPSIPTISTVSAAATEGQEPEKSQKIGIYGSVSISDIAANLKAILAEDEEGARVSLGPEDIGFVQHTDDKDRVKHLGIFEIEIQLKGAVDIVKRTIQVHAQN